MVYHYLIQIPPSYFISTKYLTLNSHIHFNIVRSSSILLRGVIPLQVSAGIHELKENKQAKTQTKEQQQQMLNHKPL